MKTSRVNLQSKSFWITIISLLVIVPLGFYCKYYDGPAAAWVNDSLAGLFYEIFWCLLIFLFLPQVDPLKIAVGVFLATSVLEFLQLWHPPVLEYLRSFFLGAALLGTSFVWWDFVYYFIGCLIGWVWMKCLTSSKGF